MTTLQELTRVELTAILCSDVNVATRREAADALYLLGYDTGYDLGIDLAKEVADQIAATAIKQIREVSNA